MNEVNFSKAADVFVARSASSKGATEAQPQKSGNTLPDQAETVNEATEPKAPERSEKELEVEVAQVNDYVQSVQRDLQFSVDKELDRTVIKVVDSGSGELIRQIPEDIFLELARKLKTDGELQLVSSIG